MGPDVLVTVTSWRQRAGERVAGRVDTIRAADLERRLRALCRARKHADAYRGRPCPDDAGGELVGEVCPHPDNGRLVWWCVRPDPTGEGA